jgi:catechol 2,3-dioxygenase
MYAKRRPLRIARDHPMSLTMTAKRAPLFAKAPVAILPAATQLGPVTLRVADAERSLAWYRDLLGFEAIERTQDRIALGAGGKPFLFLELRPGAPPRPQRATGLYHVAILLPDRAALGGRLARLIEARVRLGAADHEVSEAIYIWDPDGNGLELYRDRPRASWTWENGQVRLPNDPLDFAGLIAEPNVSALAAAPMPTGTHIGHVHLQVGDLDTAERFYCDVLGFVVTRRLHDGALFVSAGGYHHHVALNVWESRNGPLPPEHAAGLVEFVVDLPDRAAVAATRARFEAAGLSPESDGEGFLVRDPWQNALRVRSTPAVD